MSVGCIQGRPQLVLQPELESCNVSWMLLPYWVAIFAAVEIAMVTYPKLFVNDNVECTMIVWMKCKNA